MQTCFIVVWRNLVYVYSPRITYWVPLILTIVTDMKQYNRFHGSMTPTNVLTALLHQILFSRLYQINNILMALPNQTHLDKTYVSFLQRVLNESRRTVQCVKEYWANGWDEKINAQVLSKWYKMNTWSSFWSFLMIQTEAFTFKMSWTHIDSLLRSYYKN